MTSNAGEVASPKALDLNMPNREVLQDRCNRDFFNTICVSLPFRSRRKVSASARDCLTKRSGRSDLPLL